MKLNKVRVSVDGLNRFRLIKQLTEQGIALEKVASEPGNPMKFTINSANKQKTFAILKKLCYNYTIEWDYSVASLLKQLLLRVGVVAGIVIGVTASIIASKCAMFVKTTGLDETTAIAVETTVKKTANLPAITSGISTEKIKSAVMALDGVAQCNVTVRGNYVIIDALPVASLEHEKPGGEIVSDEDAIVTRIIANAGTALVDVGDVVKKGAPLISGEIKSAIDGTLLETVVPNGTVYGEVVMRASAVIGEKRTVKRFTGRKTTKAYLLYNKYSPKIECPYVQADMQVQSCKMNVFLPLVYTKITFTETVTEEASFSVEDTARQLMSELRLNSTDCVEKESRVSTLDLGGGLKKVSVYLIVEKKIGG